MMTPAKPSIRSAAPPIVKEVATHSILPLTGAPAKGKATASTEPSLRFHHSQALRDRTNKVLSALETQPGQSCHGQAIADLVTELIEAGMDYYFMKVLKQAGVGFVAEQSARLGISGAVKLLSSVSRKFITRMDQAQLLVVAIHIRSLAASSHIGDARKSGAR